MSVNSRQGLVRWLTSQLLSVVILLTVTSTQAAADVVLKLGDILVAEPGTARISVVDPLTGSKTVISEGGLLGPAYKTVGVALAPNGDIIVVNRVTGLIRVNPATGAQSVLSTGGSFRDPWAIAINKDTGDIYVADSGYDNDRPEINQAGKIIRVDPVSGAQQIIASGSPCNVFPSNAACQNTTSAGSYLSHPYGIAIDYALFPGTLIVADMASFNGKGAIVRIQPSPNGTQTLLWGPSTAVPAPQVAQQTPLGCPMGVAVEPNGNILTTVFDYPVPETPTIPPPPGTFYGCAPPGIFRIDLLQNTQSIVNANAPEWQPNNSYSVGAVIRDRVTSSGDVHRVVTAGVSNGSAPPWNGAPQGETIDGSVIWQNIGAGANWLIPFGIDTESAPTPTNPSAYNIVVGDEGYSMLFRLDADGEFVTAPLSLDISNVTSVDVINFNPPGGTDLPPDRFNGQPSGTLPSSTTQTTLSLSTNELATCRYSLQPGVAYGSMTSTFATTGSTSHAQPVSGLTAGSYHFYVRCVDTAGNANPNDFEIAFAVASSSAPTSSFTGNENPLSENGTWDSPGSWADLQKSNGAFTAGLNAAARLVTPVLAADQFSEITYDQDPGASSWVGVMTRVQSAGNGSGYLAIVYAGEVRLYRTDDSGSLNFTLLASAAASIGAAPRRLRLQSEGTNHKVFFNGTQVINHDASGTTYGTGQPGIAASVFGGPQVKILSFDGGSLGLPETTPPVRSNGQPVGILPIGTTQATLSLTTNETATCRYSTIAGISYSAMTGIFTTTGASAHATTVTGLVDGGSYSFFVRCQDSAANSNPDDLSISFGVASSDTAPPVLSNGQPFGSLPAGTTQTMLGVTTNEAAACRYSTTPEVAYSAMTGTFTTTGGTAHTTAVTGLLNGTSYSFFVRCQDSATNANPIDFAVSFAVARPGLVAAYGFDEASGTTTSDASGNNLTGTLSNVTRTTAGKFGSALSFNGVNAWVTVPDANPLDLTTGMTLEAWVNPTANGNGVWRNVLIKERTAGEVYNLYANVATNVPTVFVATPSAVLDAHGTAAVPLNTWTHLAATYDGTTLRLFVNGIQVGTRAVAGALVTSNGALRIGGNNVWGEYFQGNLDEIRIYNRALNATEITADMNTRVGGTPTVRVNQAAGQADPSNASPINFTAVFSVPVADFAGGDVSLGGTAGATTAVVTGGPTTYNIAVSGMTNNGTVTAAVGAGVAHDAAANGNAASTSTDNTVTFDASTLTVTIDQAAGQAGSTNASPINFTAVFSTPVADFATGDVTLGGTAGATTAVVSGGPTTYNIAVSGMTTSGTVIATVGAGVAHNAAQIANTASTSTDNTVTYSISAPTVTINQATGQGDPAVASPINFTVVFSESVTGFTAGDVSLGGTTGATIAAVTGGPTSYNVAVSGMTTSGTVSATVAAGVAHDAAGNGNGASTSTDNTVTYDASSLPSLSISSVMVPEGDAGTADAIFTVTLSSASSQLVTVNYATANDTAAAPADYTAKSNVLTFPIGSTTQLVTVAVVGDTLDEASEQFRVNLTNPSGATISQGQGTATISDNDPPPSLSINNASVTEVATGTANATFTVTLSVASGQPVTVNYTTIDGTATAPADYTATAGTLTFPAGIRTQQIIVPAANDLLDENPETYTVSLSDPSGATIGTAIGTGTINDNSATPSLAIDSVSVTEGNAGSITAAFTVTLSAVSGRQVTVNYATANNTATAASGDYTAITTTPLTFAPGVTTRTINVSVVGDTRYEAAETFRVNLSSATNAAIAVSQGTGTIVNDDTPPSLTISSPVVTETNSGSTTMTFVVSLSAASGVGTTVSFATADGTAVAGSDYTSRIGTLTIGAGSISGNIAITRFGDTIPEANETLFVDLNSPTNATIAQSRGTGTINDNDGTVTVTSPNTTVTWTVGSTRLITWTTSNNFTAGATFRVELSRDGGTTFELVAASVPNATATTGSYSWTVTGPATTQGRVRVTWTVNGRVTDISNTNFTIGP